MVIGSKRGKVPSSGKQLSDYAEGDIVLLNESGSPVEFYVACHDYESGLNGAGRTLLVRKDLCEKMGFGSSTAYASNTLDTWLNGTYKTRLDAAVQSALGKTTFYYTNNSDDDTVVTLSRAVFTPSATEYISEADPFWFNTEGSTLPIASTLLIAYLNGVASEYWTRSCCAGGGSWANFMQADGTLSAGGSALGFCARPCFTLPSTAKFDEETLLFEGVA